MTDRIERALVLPVPPEEVWSIITSDGWLADEVRIDLVPGGEAHFADRDGVRAGWVEEARAPDRKGGRLIFWWAREGEATSRVELMLEALDDRSTRLRIAETRPLEVLDVSGIPLPGQGGHSYGPALLAVA